MPVSSNLEEYARPDLYDLENSDLGAEGAFYLSLAGETGGPVLEVGCGTGRYVIPLAQHGLAVTGVELVPAMLARARDKASQAGDLAVRLVEADARSFQLGQTFNFIFEGGGVFMHMLSNADQDAFLARVREHLAPQGRFVVSLFFPQSKHLGSVDEEQEWFDYPDGQGGVVRVSGTEQYDALAQVKLETAVRRVQHADGSESMHIAPLRLRYTFPQEMERLLACAGFEVLERYGGPDRSPLSAESTYMIFVCGLSSAG